MDQGTPAWELPVPCPSTATAADVTPYLPQPRTGPPASSYSSLPPAAEGVPSAAVLQAAAAWLEGTEVRYLEQAAAASPDAALQQLPALQGALLQLAPHALDIRRRARPAPAQAPPAAAASVPAPPAATASGSKPRRAGSAPNEQQQQGGATKAPAAASRKRKSHADSTEAFVPKVVNKKQVAEGAGRAVVNFLDRLAAVRQDQEPADSDATAGSAAADAALSSLAGAALPAVARELAAAREQEVLHLVDAGQLQQLLAGLLPLIKQSASLQLPGDEQVVWRAVALALDTATACLQVLAAPGMPTQLYTEELLTSTIELTKTQLQYNILAFCDPKYQRLYRPSLTADDGNRPTKKAKTMAQPGVPKVVPQIVEKVRSVLHLLSLVVTRARVQAELLLPLTRLALATLVTDSLKLLQLNAIDLAVAVFKAYPQHREAVMSDMMSGVFNQLGSKAPARHFVVGLGEGGGKVTQVQMSTGLIMRLVQAAVELPALDADPELVFRTFTPAVACADAFWQAIFKLLPSAKAVKSDTAQDFKALLDELFADLLTAQCLPEWPAADTLLRRGVKALLGDQGMQAADSGVKLMAVEATGLVAARLFQAALQEEQERSWTEQLLGMAGLSTDEERPERSHADFLQHVLLDALQRSAAASPQQASACSYLCCNMLQETLNQMRKQQQQVDPQQLHDLVLHHRQMLGGQLTVLSEAAGLDSSVKAALAALQEDPFPLDLQQAGAVMRKLVMDGPMGQGRRVLLMRLADASDRGRQDANAAQVRAKAVKALAGVVEVDTRVLHFNAVRGCLQTALLDESISVREAAIELLGRYLTTNPLLAEEFFDVIAAASNDNGISVRKRAIKTLWDCCVHCPGFTRRPDAVVAILQRAGDHEQAMQTLVTRICSAMWFDPCAVVDADFSSSEGRSAVQRAQDLADVALRVYDSGAKAVRVPLASNHPLVVVIRECLSSGSGSSAKQAAAVLAGAQEVAEALLELIIQAQAEDQEGGPFAPLLALHTLCCAEPSLLVPDRDPATFLRSLAPYVTPTPPEASAPSRGSPTAVDVARRQAEVCVALLSTLTAVLRQLQAADRETLAGLMVDLEKIIVKAYTPTVAAACQCLAALSELLPEAGQRICAIAQQCFKRAESLLFAANGPPASGVQVAQLKPLPRFILVLGQLCRYGSDILDAAAADEGGAADANGAADAHTPSCQQCLQLFIQTWSAQLPPAARAVAEAAKQQALQSMGLVFLAQPSAMLQEKPSEVYASVLTQGNHPASIKARVLANLVELLQVEEDTLVARQKAAEAEAAAAALPSINPAKDARPLQRINGEGDSFGVCSGILQRHWDSVLQLATAAGDEAAAAGLQPGGIPGTPATPGGGMAEAAAAAGLRRKAIELIEVVLRGGLVAPWTAVPPLVALLTDTQQETRALAVRVLKGAADKHTEFVAGQLSAGITEAYLFHKRMWHAKHPTQSQPQVPDPHLIQGLSTMYSDVVQQDNKMRHKVLSSLLKVFEDASNIASRAAADADPYLLSAVAHLVGALTFKRGEEPLMLLHSINLIVGRSGPLLQDKLRSCLVRCGLHGQLQLDVEELEDAAAGATAAAGAGQGAAANGAAHGSANSSHLVNHPSPDQLQPGATREGGMTPTTPAAVAAAAGANGFCGPPAGPLQGEALVVVKASLAVAMLLVLKQFLMVAYHLTPERVAGFELRGEKKRAEEKAMVSRAPLEFTLDPLKLRCLEDRQGNLLVAHYNTFQQLLEADVATHRHVADHAGSDADEGDAAMADGDAEQPHQQQQPSTAKKEAGGGQPLLLFQDAIAKLPRTGSVRSKGGKRSRRSSAATAEGPASLRRASSTTASKGAATGGKGGRGGKRKQRKRKDWQEADTEDEEDDEEDEVYNPSQRLTYK